MSTILLTKCWNVSIQMLWAIKTNTFLHLRGLVYIFAVCVWQWRSRGGWGLRAPGGTFWGVGFFG